MARKNEAADAGEATIFFAPTDRRPLPSFPYLPSPTYLPLTSPTSLESPSYAALLRGHIWRLRNGQESGRAQLTLSQLSTAGTQYLRCPPESERTGKLPLTSMTVSRINHPRSWNGKALPGEWLVTLKLDGVRAIWHDESGWVSRANKPLCNIPPWQRGQARDCEVFVSNFRDTIIATRTRSLKEDTPSIRQEHLYGLDPLDRRLRWRSLTNPTPADIRAQLHRANKLDYEGLVLRQGDQWIKVKPEETHDISITGYAEGRGKHRGRLGFVTTSRGAVGAGFTDAEREILWAEAKAERLVGQVIEVSCMQFTPNGQFRHPVFVRMRPDKVAAWELPSTALLRPNFTQS